MSYVNSHALHSALREWQAHMMHPTRLAGLFGAAAILTLLAPFNTGEEMRVVPRFIYWAVNVVLSYSAGYAANMLVSRWPSLSLIQRIAIAGAMTGALVFVIVIALDGLALGQWPAGREFGIIAGNVLVISTIIAGIFQVAYSTKPLPEPSAPPALLDRLTLDKRGRLVSISVEDHYVRIRTTKGEEMVLLRLTDAMREVGQTAGFQAHRSHWVATDAIVRVTRTGDRATLTMSNGPDIPVSRSNITKLREAGLLPK